MLRLVIYRYGYIITKLIFIFYLLKEHAKTFYNIVGVLIAPTIYWLHHFDANKSLLVHLGVLNIVTMWLYYLTFLYDKYKDEDPVKRYKLLKKIKRYKDVGLIIVSDDDWKFLQELTIEALEDVLKTIKIPEEINTKGE